MSRCHYQQDWAGRCTNEADGRFCAEHATWKCGIEGCTANATHNCPQTMQFVCGFRLCDDHTTAVHWGHREKEPA